MRKLIFLLIVLVLFQPGARAQNWSPQVSTVSWNVPINTGNTETSFPFWFSNQGPNICCWQVNAINEMNVELQGGTSFSVLTSGPGLAQGPYCGTQPTTSLSTPCYILFTFQSTTEPPLTTVNVQLPSLTTIIVFSPPPPPVAGKYVLFETAPTSSTTGGRCYDEPSPANCFYAFLDFTVNTNGSISAPINPLNTTNGTTFLELDNANFTTNTGTNFFHGTVSGSDINLSINVGVDGAVESFQGTQFPSQPWTGVNFDGSAAPFSGTAPEIIGQNSGSGGPANVDDGVSFQAWQFPSLGTSDLSINFTSQPGSLNQAESLTMTLEENADFSVTATGTVTGPPAPCGPLTFNLNAGETIGPLYGLNGTFQDAQGGQGQMSIGLFLVTPFVVSQQALQAAGYNASGNGIPVQVWSFDYSATPACAADPAIGLGVAYLKHRHPHHEREENKDREKFDWKKFTEKYQARTRE